jgi:serine/threonine protein kinase|uniref:Protein kinase domain-containing protein n=1 Tax=viral metagenome TaxID=1070528 RepID=A0A6C0CB50_9ZZZZ
MFVKGSFNNYNIDLSCAKLELTPAHLENKIFEDWEIAPWELFIFEDKLLGEGASSKVYLAKWRETLVVAKVIDPEFAKIKKSFVLREIAIMSKLHHPNIVQFLGFIDDPFIIVLEYIVNGTISSNMRNFNKKQKLSIMKDILRGLAYLHNRRPLSLIHRDIKPSNILITSSKMAKIADFGLSKFYNIPDYNDSSNNVCSCVGSRRYMAPEIYNRDGHYNHKVDIYSAGILFYELLESKTYIPYNSLKWFYTSNHLKKIISEFMVSHDPYKRYDALDILKLL